MTTTVPPAQLQSERTTRADTGGLVRVVAAHALAATGMSLPWPLLLAATWSATGDDALLGLAGAARMLPYVLCSWWVARLADRHGRGRVVAASLWLRVGLLTAAAATLAAGVGAGGGALGASVVLCALAVAAGTPAYPALVAALPSFAQLGGCRARTVQRATTLLVTVEVSSFVVGPAIGGLFLGRVSPWMVGLLGAGLTLAARALLAPVALDPRTSYAVRSPVPVATARPGQALRVRRVRGAIGAICVVNLVGAGLLVALVPMADDRWGDPTAYGLATAGFGFGALAGPLLWWLGRSPVRKVHAGMAVFAAVLVALVAADALPAAVAVLALGGAVAVHVEAAATEVLQAAVPEAVRAGVLGTTDALMVAAAMVGSLVGPFALSALGPAGLLAGLAVLTVVAGAVALPVIREELAVDAV